MAQQPHLSDVDRDVDLSARASAQSAWTFGTLFLHLRSEIRHVETRLLDKMDGAAKAVEIASNANEVRLTGLNELREVVQDQQGRFTTKAEAEARLSSLADKVDVLTKRLDSIGDTTAGASRMWLLIIGGLVAIGTLVSVFLQIRGVPVAK